MPIPFLAGLGIAAAGVVGAGSHLSAQEKNERAQRVSEMAQDIYNDAKKSLEKAQNETEKSLLELGYTKKRIFDSSLTQFLDLYEKIKEFECTESKNINEISKFSIDKQEAIQLRKMVDIYSNTMANGATGAATGAIVALAASGSLSLIGSEMAVAGSVLAAGEIGTAAGIAGSALSFGAAMTPLAAVAAPALLFTGISANMKADENLEKANTMYAEAELAVEKMKISEVLCNGISDKADMFNVLLIELNKMFAVSTSLIAGVMKKKEGRFFKKKLKSKDFSQEEMELISSTCSLAKAIKTIIDVPILLDNGEISPKVDVVAGEVRQSIPQFKQQTKNAIQISYDVKPIISKYERNRIAEKKAKTRKMALNKIRNPIAIILGTVLASKIATNMGEVISSVDKETLLIGSFNINKIGLWLIIWSGVMLIFGNFKRFVEIEKICNYCTAIGVSIFYFEYCTKIEIKEHYFIFSIILLIMLIISIFIFDGITNTLCLYLCKISSSLLSYPLFFLAYTLMYKTGVFSRKFSLWFSGISAALFIIIAISVIEYLDIIDDETLIRSRNAKIKNKKSKDWRYIVALILGITVMLRFTTIITKFITLNGKEVFWVDSFITNKCAVALILFFSIIVIIGEFKKTIDIERFCWICIGGGFFILYFEYCRRVEKMEHYIIFSIILLILLSILIFLYSIAVYINRDNRLCLYLWRVCVYLLFYPIFFLIYILMTRFFLFSKEFCLGVSSIALMLFMMAGLGMAEQTYLEEC